MTVAAVIMDVISELSGATSLSERMLSVLAFIVLMWPLSWRQIASNTENEVVRCPKSRRFRYDLRVV